MAENPPEVSVVMVPGVVATAVPSYDIVIPELGEKVVPVTVTVIPEAPIEGSNDIAGVGA